MSDRTILVTGAAGFIGFHVARLLLAENRNVVGLDSLNSYYDPALKRSRLNILRDDPRFSFAQIDLADRPSMDQLFAKHRFPVVIHLAAQAGVRHSIDHPHAYADANLEGFLNVLEGCRHHECRHLVYASSSSVDGANTKLPFSVQDNVDHPISLYAASKKANELMAHAYSHLYLIPATGLRFFTVYGARQRPDLAIHKFAKLITAGAPVPVFGDGTTRRDYTYIDDIISGVRAAIDYDQSNYEVINLGESRTVELRELIYLLETALGEQAEIDRQPTQPGDVPQTFADISKARALLGYDPQTQIEDGIKKFVEWFRESAA